jgi:ribosomal protein S18 acetylase RimI-like enzyme
MMMEIKSRLYQDREDLRKLGTFIRQAYAKAPFWNSWSFALYDIWAQRVLGDEVVHGIRDWQQDIRIWETGAGEIVGAAVFRDPHLVKLVTDPEVAGLESEMMTQVEEMYRVKNNSGKPLTIETIECNPVLELVLDSRGYSKQSGHYIFRSKCLQPDQDDPVQLPSGFHIKHIETDAELMGFFDAVKQVFNFEDNPAVYRILRQAPSFKPELDLIVLAKNQEVACFASAWLDEEASLAEFEPVGTLPAYRKMGLATAVMAKACNRLRRMGCNKATVMSWCESPGANRLYQGAGFQPRVRKNYWQWEV